MSRLSRAQAPARRFAPSPRTGTPGRRPVPVASAVRGRAYAPVPSRPRGEPAWPPAAEVVRRALLAGLMGALLVPAVFVLFVAEAALAFKGIDPPVTALMLYRAATTDAVVRPITFVPLRKLPPRVKAMFVAVEDHTFYQHGGVDSQAIRDAMRLNRELGSIYHGGSTITMQLARTLFLTPNRTYVRKAFEALAALTIEQVLDKERILELYINTIEYGKGVYGIAAASRAALPQGRDAAERRRGAQARHDRGEPSALRCVELLAATRPRRALQFSPERVSVSRVG